MTDIERIREWLQTFPRWSELLNDFYVDFTSEIPNNSGLFPAGMVENSRREDIIGNVTVENQYNFALYCVLTKPTEDDITSLLNADLVMELQKWVQEQSAQGLIPTFGDQPERETIRAQNGTMYGVDSDGTTAMYVVQLSSTFYKTIMR